MLWRWTVFASFVKPGRSLMFGKHYICIFCWSKFAWHIEVVSHMIFFERFYGTITEGVVLQNLTFLPYSLDNFAWWWKPNRFGFLYFRAFCFLFYKKGVADCLPIHSRVLPFLLISVGSQFETSSFFHPSNMLWFQFWRKGFVKGATRTGGVYGKLRVFFDNN